MFCPKCGVVIAKNESLCRNCGAKAQATSYKNASGISSAHAGVAQTRPLVRFWARVLDFYLAYIGGVYVVLLFNPHAFLVKGSTGLFMVFVLFLWVFMESFLLSATGTTAGKWLFKIRIAPSNGTKIDFSSALTRSFQVWWRGLGISIPIISLVTLFMAYDELVKNNTTTWDKEGGFTITHDRIGTQRSAFAVILFITPIVLIS